jgi:hypothetical protein
MDSKQFKNENELYKLKNRYRAFVTGGPNIAESFLPIIFGDIGTFSNIGTFGDIGTEI